MNISSVAGRRVGQGGGIYQLTKHGVGVVQRGAAPGGHRRATCAPRWSSRARSRPSSPTTCARRCATRCAAASTDEILEAEDIADAIVYIVTRPRHMAINEILIRPTEQER